jgi:small nuclear ribonucleoprotein B and B'
VTLNDGRQMTGQMLAFDKVRLFCLLNNPGADFHFVPQHMNLVLADTEEFRRTKRKSKAAPGAANTQVEAEEKRTLGLTIVRGTQVVSCSVDGPPPADPSSRLGATGPSGAGAAATLAAGPGISKPAGRGLPVGLGGPAAGVGGPPPPMGGFPPGGFPPPGFGGRGGPPGGPRK